jgi:hypothetical protein
LDDRPEWEWVFHSLARQSSRHHFGSNFRQNYFPMVPNVVAVRVGNESGVAFILWI